MARTRGERDHLVPFGREVRFRPRLQNPLVEHLAPNSFVGVAVRVLHIAADPLHAARRHEVGVAFVRLVDVDLLEPALRVVGPPQVLHLCQDFDHGGQSEDGGLFGVEGDEALAQAGAVG